MGPIGDLKPCDEDKRELCLSHIQERDCEEKRDVVIVLRRLLGRRELFFVGSFQSIPLKV